MAENKIAIAALGIAASQEITLKTIVS